MKLISANTAMITESATLHELPASFTGRKDVTVSMLLLHLNDAFINGNKWFKLRYNLEAAASAGLNQIITFGGDHSNHLAATAAATSLLGMKSVGIVRGLHAAKKKPTTLWMCEGFGMKLHVVSREDYLKKNEPDFIQNLESIFGPSYVIPEGGNNALGRKGTEHIAAFIPPDITHVCMAVGTGATMAGLRNALPVTTHLTGFPPMKGGGYLAKEIAGYLRPAQNENWDLQTEYHLGGFAKGGTEALRFLEDFYKKTGVLLDVVYTAKMMIGVQDLLANNYFPTGAHVVCIHTGGMQGNP